MRLLAFVGCTLLAPFVLVVLGRLLFLAVDLPLADYRGALLLLSAVVGLFGGGFIGDVIGTMHAEQKERERKAALACGRCNAVARALTSESGDRAVRTIWEQFPEVRR